MLITRALLFVGIVATLSPALAGEPIRLHRTRPTAVKRYCPNNDTNGHVFINNNVPGNMYQDKARFERMGLTYNNGTREYYDRAGRQVHFTYDGPVR